MRVLVACEESQEVCKAFRALGHEAYSNDLTECSGGHPEWHIVMDCMELIEKRNYFKTEDAQLHHIEKWDMLIGFPDCRYLCWSGERWITSQPGRKEMRQKAFEFFKKMYFIENIGQVAIENSLSFFLERTWKRPTQKIHPFHFGDPFRKTTCLWLRGLKPLIPTNIIYQREPSCHNGHGKSHGEERRRLRAKTYPGIAAAMAEQWGGKIN